MGNSHQKKVKVGLGEIFAEENIDVVFGMLSVCSMQFLRNVVDVTLSNAMIEPV